MRIVREAAEMLPPYIGLDHLVGPDEAQLVKNNFRAMAKDGITDLALRVFDEPFAALQIIKERVIPRIHVLQDIRASCPPDRS